MKKMYERERTQLLQTLMNQSRIRIINAIQENPLNISQIANVVGLDRSTIVYHLGLLSKVGLVNEEFKPLKAAHSTGVMGRFFRINGEKLTLAVKLATAEITEITPEIAWPKK
jgi:predicted transcriptional regulator